MSSILLVRHAQSENNARPEHERVCDPGITELGQRQAAATARALRTFDIRGLYCSPFLRSLETTRAIASQLAKDPMIRSDLFEQGGCYSGHVDGQERGEPGMGRSELQQRYPSWTVDDRIGDHGWWGHPYESLEQALMRTQQVARWLEEQVVTRCDSLDVLVIHADFKRLLLLELLGKSWTDAHNRQLGPLYNAGMSMLEYTSPGWVLHSFNAASHLARHELSA
jgi:2,3-bisphosphoglycerate-dependent phosphoglycerate mutase